MSAGKERRKWLKFVAANNMYEKSVRIKKHVSASEYYWEFEPREVCAKEPLFSAGMVLIDGFFRVRTDREYYPRCGKYGIPDDERSILARDFRDHHIAGNHKGRCKIIQKKLDADAKIRRIKAEENHRLARNIAKYDLAARLGIRVDMATDEILEAKRNQIAIFRTMREIKKITNRKNSNETN